MFVSLASKRVPVYPPRLPHAVDEGTLLSGHISTEHTTALPGYAVGKVIGEGGFCQVRRSSTSSPVRRAAQSWWMRCDWDDLWWVAAVIGSLCRCAWACTGCLGGASPSR